MLAWIFFCNNNNKSWLKLLWIVLTSVGFGLIGSAWRIDYCQQQLHKFIGSHWSAAVDSATIWCYQCCRIEAWFSFVCILHQSVLSTRPFFQDQDQDLFQVLEAPRDQNHVLEDYSTGHLGHGLFIKRTNDQAVISYNIRLLDTSV
jgi:hypothetical protein